MKKGNLFFLFFFLLCCKNFFASDKLNSFVDGLDGAVFTDEMKGDLKKSVAKALTTTKKSFAVDVGEGINKVVNEIVKTGNTSALDKIDEFVGKFKDIASELYQKKGSSQERTKNEEKAHYIENDFQDHMSDYVNKARKRMGADAEKIDKKIHNDFYKEVDDVAAAFKEEYKKAGRTFKITPIATSIDFDQDFIELNKKHEELEGICKTFDSTAVQETKNKINTFFDNLGGILSTETALIEQQNISIEDSKKKIEEKQELANKRLLSLQDENNQGDALQEKLKEDIATLEKGIEEKTTNNTTLGAEIEEITKMLGQDGDIAEILGKLQQAIEGEQKTIDETKKKSEDIRKEIEENKKKIEEHNGSLEGIKKNIEAKGLEAEQHKQQVNTLDGELNTVAQKIEEKNKELTQKTNSKELLQKTVTEKTEKNNALQKTVENGNTRITELKQNIETANNKHVEYEKAVAEKEATFKEQQDKYTEITENRKKLHAEVDTLSKVTKDLAQGLLKKQQEKDRIWKMNIEQLFRLIDSTNTAVEKNRKEIENKYTELLQSYQNCGSEVEKMFDPYINIEQPKVQGVGA